MMRRTVSPISPDRTLPRTTPNSPRSCPRSLQRRKSALTWAVMTAIDMIQKLQTLPPQEVAKVRQWLIEQDLAREDENGRTVYRANLLAQLRRRDLNRAAGQLSSELGLAYTEAKPGECIEGTYRRAVDLASGRFAVVERSKDFTLVPWRPVLERNVGKAVSGIARDEGISWTFGRQRKGLEIS